MENWNSCSRIKEKKTKPVLHNLLLTCHILSVWMNRESLWQMDSSRFSVWWSIDSDRLWLQWIQFPGIWTFYDLIPVILLVISAYVVPVAIEPNVFVVDIDALNLTQSKNYMKLCNLLTKTERKVYNLCVQRNGLKSNCQRKCKIWSDCHKLNTFKRW